MRKYLALVALAAVCGILAGCPRLSWPKGYKYTSADLQGGYRNLAGYLDTAAGGGGGGEADTRQLVEPDVIRQVGDTLFVLNQYRGLTLVDLNTQTILDQVATLGFPRDLYVVGDRAYVLVAYAADFTRKGNTVDYTIASRLYVVDISEPTDCAIVSTFGLDGDLTDSRLVGDVLYAITAEYDWSWVDAIPLKAKTSASHITSVNISDENHIFKADQVSTNNIGDVVYATSSAIFIAGWDWNKAVSTITYIDIGDPGGALQVGGSIGVKGYIADRFKMDVYNGVLRVVSNGWQDGARTYITTVDIGDPNNLKTLADVEFERANGDTLFATRFDGARAYVVTFFRVDPLFVLDLSDPLNPAVSGELEVPGWSTHIEPRGDRLVALGVDNTNGWQVSVSLFNVSDPANPSLTDRVSFGKNWSWSSAYNDVKALTVLDDTIIVPFSGWEEAGGGFDRLQFVSWTPDDLTKRGTVDLKGSILRSFAHGGFYYGVTTEQLAQIDGSDPDHPAITRSTTLAENIADFVELSAKVGVEIVTQYDTGETTARAVGLPLKGGLGKATVNVGNLVDTHKYGSSVVLVGASWSDEPKYKIAAIDFGDPSAPEVTGELTVNVWPYYGYWWILPLYDRGGGGGGVVPAGGNAGVAVDSVYWPWFPSYRQNSTMAAGSTLVLRCTADSFDQTIGSGPAYEGLALVDLESLQLTKTVGLGFPSVSGVDAVGGKVYISSKTYVNTPAVPLTRGPECAYFITEFDPLTLTAGPTVNVPGALVQYDPSSGVLTLRDDQWDANYSYTTLLRTVSWNGGTGVSTIDNVTLPAGSSSVLGRGAKVYVEAYDNGVRLGTVNVSPAGLLQNGGGATVTTSWGNLIDANATSAYFGIGGGAIARYDCAGAPDLKELVEVMGTPTSIRFGKNAAYAPMGYFGIVQLPQ